MSRRKKQTTTQEDKFWSREYMKALRGADDALKEVIEYMNTMNALAIKKLEIIKKYFTNN